MPCASSHYRSASVCYQTRPRYSRNPRILSPKFKHLLVAYYEDHNEVEMLNLMKEKCWQLF